MKTLPVYPRRTRQEKREETRARLRDAARRLFAAEGVMAASVDRLTQMAGLSRGAFYANYSSKEDLALELVQEGFEEAGALWRAAAEDCAGVEPLIQKLLALFDATEDKRPRYARLAMELMLHAEREPTFRRRFRAFAEAHHESVASVYRLLFEYAEKIPPADLFDLSASTFVLSTAAAVQASHLPRRERGGSYQRKMYELYLRGMLAVAQPMAPSAKAARSNQSLASRSRRSGSASTA